MADEEELHLKDLLPDPQNARKHNPRNIGVIVSSLQEVGAARSIVIDESNVVLAGNGVIEGAAEAGMTKVRVVEADGHEIIAVRRRNLTEEQKKRLALFDNRAGELSAWDADVLSALMEAQPDLRKGMWDSDEISRLLAGVSAKPGLTDPDEVPETRATEIVRGDYFALGNHRLLCGDATLPSDVERLLDGAKPALMVTDPPYGVNYHSEWRIDVGLQPRAATGEVVNDNRWDWTPAWRLFAGQIAYVWHGGLFAGPVGDTLVKAGLPPRAQIIWAKPVLVIGRGNYHWQHEPCWYCVRKGKNAAWASDRKQTTLWEIENMHPAHGNVDDGKNEHSTQKPVECMARPMRHHVADEVYDPFVGSGTSIIAAEQLGRRCFAMEINPTYVQLSIDRWEAFTGQKAVKVAAAVTTGDDDNGGSK